MSLLSVMRRRDGSHAMWQTNKRVCRTIRLRSAGGPPGPDSRSVVVRPTELAPSRIQVPGLRHRHLSIRGGCAHNIREHGAQKGILEGSGFSFPACAWATTGTRPPLPPIAHLSPAARAILQTSCPAQRTRSSTWPSRCVRARGGSPCRGARAGASCTRRCWFRS